MELKEILETKFQELTTWQEKARADLDSMGAVAAETKGAIELLQTDLDALRLQIEKSEQKEIETGRSFIDVCNENEDVQRLAKNGNGSAVLHFKSWDELARLLETRAVITSSGVGSATSGVLQIDREAGVEPLARKRLFIRNLLRSISTTQNAIDYVKVSSAPMSPAMQTEGSAKSESSLNFATATANVRTLAHWIPATKQVLADFAGLQAVINSELLYFYRDKEETQLLSGSGTGQNLNGLVTQATSFTTSLLGSAYTKIDQIRRVLQQVSTANELRPSWIALNPVDWADIELTKEAVQANYGGNYIVGSPRSGLMAPNIWGLTVVETNNLSSGTFLLGNSVGAHIRDREGVTIEISTEHSDFFTKNKVAIRCEGRLALVVRRPASYITGSFVTSP